MPILAILLWPPVIAVKLVLVVLGFIVVPVGMAVGRIPTLYRNDESRGRPYTLWEMVVRNPVDGFKYLLKHPKSWKEAGLTEPGPTYHDKAFAWRWRRSGLLASIRLVWVFRKRKKYGELYLGWKIGSEPPDLDFATSLRPFSSIGQ